MDALINLDSLGGDLEVYNNDALTSLSGLDNISAKTILNLSIKNNNVLSACAVMSICNYLAAPNGSVEIDNNASGCDNPEEVEVVCEYLYLADDGIPQLLNFFPNPARDIVKCQLLAMENDRGLIYVGRFVVNNQ
jgi:hypothetical protein